MLRFQQGAKNQHWQEVENTGLSLCSGELKRLIVLQK